MIKKWLKENNVPFENWTLTYSVNDSIKTLTLEQAIEATEERIKTVSPLNLIKKKYQDNKSNYNLKDVDFYLDLKDFIKDMSEWKVWEKEITSKFKQKGFEDSFVKWICKELKISKNQLNCEHDFNDQFSSDGRWYNSVVVCKKCLASGDFEDIPNLSLIYKAWKSKK